jgi:PadR family transcriptional regulator PadR
VPQPVFLGEFEQLVLLALLKIADEPHALGLREELDRLSGRSVSRGALYRTLDRLEQKGYVATSTEPGGAERRGHRRRLFAVTETGKAQLRASRETLMDIWQDVAEALR